MGSIRTEWSRRATTFRRLTLFVIFFSLGSARLSTADQTTLGGEPGGEAKQMAEELSRYMSQARLQNQRESDLVLLTARYGTALLPDLKAYVRDPNTTVASQVNRSLIILSNQPRSGEERVEIVTWLMEMFREQYETTCRTGPDMGHHLLAFSRASDYSPAAKEILRELFLHVADGTCENPYYIRDILLLVGIADMRSELPCLQELIERWDEPLRERYQRSVDEAQMGVDRSEGKVFQDDLKRLRKTTYWQDTTLWTALLVCARMGVQEDIDRCIEMAESHPNPDYRSIRLFGELAYVCRPEVVEYLARYPDNDERPSFRASDVIVMSYAQSAAKAIRKMLDGTPVRFPYSTPSRKDIEALKTWMTEQTEWRFVR
jgi:hypothetical protein